MDQLDSTTTTQKGKHLSFKERAIIELLLKEKMSVPKIAKKLGRCPNTIRNEIERGTVLLYNGKVQRYKAETGQKVYDENRRNCGRHYDILEKGRFINYVNQQFYKEGWSLDVCVGRALLIGGFDRSEIVCTRTLYNYVDLGLMKMKNIDLPEKTKRRVKALHPRKNKRVLGRSIEERPEEIQTRNEFGHWEADLVIGQNTKEDHPLLTLYERKTRQFFIIPIPDKKPESVMSALEKHMGEYSEHVKDVFKTITTDNGSEFAQLSRLEELVGTLVYFAHPYSSFEKGGVERHNGLIRRFTLRGVVLAITAWTASCRLSFGAMGFLEKYLVTERLKRHLTMSWT